MILLHNLHVDVKNVTEMMLNVTCDLLKYVTFFPLSNFFDICNYKTTQFTRECYEY